MTSFVQYNATMATASMTMASHSVVDHNSSMSVSVDHHVDSREELIEKLKLNLVRYARSNDRRMLLRSLKDVTFLKYIPLEAPVDQSDVPVPELEKEVAEERVTLNGILLKPRRMAETKNVFTHAGTNNGCTRMINALGKELCENSIMDEKTLYQTVLARLSKKSLSTDIYFQLNSMMGSADLVVQEITSENATNNTGVVRDLKLYNTGGQIQMTLDTTINYGLFRKSDVIINRPWVVMQCKVHERCNLSMNESFRSLSVKTPDLY